MAKWQPPHPAKTIITPVKCKLGQRFSTLDQLRGVADGPLAPLAPLFAKLHTVRCSQCQGGFHLVNADELFRHRQVLTEVTNR